MCCVCEEIWRENPSFSEMLKLRVRVLNCQVFLLLDGKKTKKGKALLNFSLCLLRWIQKGISSLSLSPFLFFFKYYFNYRLASTAVDLNLQLMKWRFYYFFFIFFCWLNFVSNNEKVGSKFGFFLF